MKTSKTVKVRLDETATAHLVQMMATLSGEARHLSLVPSKVVSWIISEFATRYFSKEKQRITDGLFNRKSFLKSMLSNLKDGSDEEIEQLKSALMNLKLAKTRPAETLPQRKQVPASQSERCLSPEGEH